MKRNAVPTSGFWMETELLYPEKKQKVFTPVDIRNEEGVVYMRVEQDTGNKEHQRDTVKVIAM